MTQNKYNSQKMHEVLVLSLLVKYDFRLSFPKVTSARNCKTCNMIMGRHIAL